MCPVWHYAPAGVAPRKMRSDALKAVGSAVARVVAVAVSSETAYLSPQWAVSGGTASMISIERGVLGALGLMAAVFVAGLLAIAQRSGPGGAARAIVVTVILLGANAYFWRTLKEVQQRRPLFGWALTGLAWGLTSVLAQWGFGIHSPWCVMLVKVAAMTVFILVAVTFVTRLCDR